MKIIFLKPRCNPMSDNFHMPRYKNDFCKHNGFTLIELMVALVILTILMGFAIPEVISQIRLAKYETQKTNLKEIRKAIDDYFKDRGRYPKKLQDLTTTTHPYFSEIPIDPVSGAADWQVAEKDDRSKWYYTSVNDKDSGLPRWDPGPESSVYHIRARPSND